MREMVLENFTARELRHLKESEIIALERNFNTLVGLIQVLMMLSGCTFIAAIAMFIWFTKFTIFLVVVGVGLIGVMWIVYRAMFKDSAETLAKVQENIKERMRGELG